MLFSQDPTIISLSSTDSLSARSISVKPSVKKSEYEENIIPKLKYGRALKLAISMGVLFILFLISFSFFTKFEGADTPECRPIYMYPSYAKIDGFDHKHTRFAPKYHLYLYREQGKDILPLEDDKIQLNGVPVLFIPGNAGSFKQVRSIAAAAANIYYDSFDTIKNSQNTHNLDFFTADFNEDFTAFHGRTMLDQAEYVNDAVKYILSLYASSSKAKNFDTYGPLPKSVILIGHSMGGIVAKVMPTLRNYIPESINTIITLSSPHSTAPVTFDGDILKIYNKINRFWEAQYRDSNSFFYNNVSLISITGGILDNVLPADYTSIESIIPYKNGFTVYTTTISGVWTSIDHLAIVWCDQLRTIVAKSLLEIVDKYSSMKTISLSGRMKVFRKKYLSGFEVEAAQDYNVVSLPGEHIKKYEDAYFKNSIVVESDTYVSINSSFPETFDRHYILNLPLKSEELNFNLITSSKDNLELLFCQRNVKRIELDNLTEESQLRCVSALDDLNMIPNFLLDSSSASSPGNKNGHHPFHMMSINSTILSRYDTIIMSLKSSSNAFADFELTTRESTETLNINLFMLFFKGCTILVDNNKLVNGFRLPHLWTSLVSLNVFAKQSYVENTFKPFIRQYIEQPFETKWHIIKGTDGMNVKINQHNVSPYIPVELTHDKSLKMAVMKSYNTKLTLKLGIDWGYTFKMLFIRYRLIIASLPFSLVCLALLVQFRFYIKSGNKFFPSFKAGLVYIIETHLTLLLTMSAILSIVTNYLNIQHLLYLTDPIGLNDPFFPSGKNVNTNNYYLGLREIFMAWLGPFFCLISIMILYLLATLFDGIEYISYKAYSLICVAKPLHSLDIGLGPNIVSTNQATGIEHNIFNKRRIVGATSLICLVLFYIPYQFAFVILFVLQLLVCIKMSKLLGRTDDLHCTNLRNYNNSILMFFLFVLPINVPVVIVFLHNFAINWETPFRSHHNCLSIISIILLVESNTAYRIPRFSEFTGRVLLLLLGFSVYFSVVYGVRNLYGIHILLNICCAWLFMNSLNKKNLGYYSK
ncbi:related to GPI inositol-deacylase [Saccharomycodes ludwigii]|uniref:GPI inositol-deacylase n=1 Tax=Saccharomycodes ludwigii TaxID=36035 RepID=A0A376B4J3_9ASCO|nr:related to GPI inositol-deacylase [Saccharomycodes ludwigii]